MSGLGLNLGAVSIYGSAQGASKLVFGTHPSETGEGSTISSITVEAQNSGGTLVSSWTGNVTVAITTNPSSGTLSGTKTVAAVGGVATFDDLNIDNNGTGYVLQATATGLTSGNSNAFNIIAPPDPIHLMPLFCDSIVQGTWTLTMDSNYIDGGYYINTSHDDGDGIQFKAFMSRGTYSLTSVYYKGANYGIMKVKIDGSVVQTVDCYSGSVLRNQITTTTGISVTTSGVKTIQVVVDGKNASAGNHYLAINEFLFFRTA